MRGPRYCAAPSATLRVIPLDLVTLVYHRRSGITHVLAPPAPEIIAALAAPLTIDALFATLAADYALIEGDMAALAARVEELVAAGLVEQL